jgi:hypothetical protein
MWKRRTELSLAADVTKTSASVEGGEVMQSLTLVLAAATIGLAFAASDHLHSKQEPVHVKVDRVHQHSNKPQS